MWEEFSMSEEVFNVGVGRKGARKGGGQGGERTGGERWKNRKFFVFFFSLTSAPSNTTKNSFVPPA